jgi:hypothetical protein
MQGRANDLAYRRVTAGGFGLSLLGWVGATAAGLAALMIWTLLTAPADVAVAVASGPSTLASAMVRVVFEAVRRLLSWL